MRNTRDYSQTRYRKRPRVRHGHAGPVGEFWFFALIAILVIGAARMDYVIQRDCNGNQACLNAVMP